MRYFFIFLFIGGMVNSLRAQDLDKHRWKDRVLLLITSDLKNPEYIRQTNALQEHPAELEERKLVVYTLLENRFVEGLPPGPWKKGRPLKIGAKNNPTDFRVVLIGLDGGVKLDEPSHVPIEVLSALIDGMPMRRTELKNKGNP